MNKFLVVIAFLMAIQFSLAQDYKFGKVSKAELEETENPNDTEANASVLYRNQNIHFDYVSGQGFVQKNEIHERIKIYNKNGFDHATKIIRLYNENNEKQEDLRALKALTYNLEGGKIKEVKLKKDGIFSEETNKYWKTKKFTMPNVKEGSVIEYKYSVVSPFLSIDEVDFQQNIPIKKLDFKLATPEYYNYKLYVNPKASFYPKLLESSKRNKIVLNTKERTGWLTTKTTYDNSVIDYIEKIVAVNENNIPALMEEPMVSNISNFKAQIRFELNFIKYPNEPLESLSTTWEKVCKTIYDYPEFGNQLMKKGYYEDDVQALLSGVEDPVQKIATILDFVKSKVKWNDYNGYRTDEGVRKAYKEGTGNVADINLMLVSMLNSSGLNANPILVSTRDNGIPLFPTRRGFNYVICDVQLGEGNILLDASDKFSSANILPLKALNWQGRLIRKDGTSSWVDLTPTKPSREITYFNVKINSDLSISGKVRNQYTDYQAFNYRWGHENQTNEEILETMLEDIGEVDIFNLEIKNQDVLSKPISQSYDYNIDNALEQIGDKYYFSPLLFLASDENPFKEDTRMYPIDFIYPVSDKYIVNIMLPDGYEVDALPESSKGEFNGKDCNFTYLVRQNGNMIQVSMSLTLNKTLILPSEYQAFKEFYQLFIDKQTEKIVLKKSTIK